MKVNNQLNYDKKELLYLLGALLGDGCAYKWRESSSHYVILIGDEKFTNKYASYASECIGKTVKPFFITSKRIWSMNIANEKLFLLFKEIRVDLNKIIEIVNNDKTKALLFVEGFFDAEGCVKIIKEEVRKTPKVCLDITNTNFKYLELIRNYLKTYLDIEARYSIQKPDKLKNKQIAYHLRIYKKEYVRRFFENIHTTKLKEEKVPYVEKWLNNGL